MQKVHKDYCNVKKENLNKYKDNVLQQLLIE